jgi:hypothetical protein
MIFSRVPFNHTQMKGVSAEIGCLTVTKDGKGKNDNSYEPRGIACETDGKGSQHR